jgi:flagellar hook assembly protein FlgD
LSQQLAKLTTLNKDKTHLFDRHQQEPQLQLQETSYIGILQANNKLDDLISWMSSLGSLQDDKHLQ